MSGQLLRQFAFPGGKRMSLFLAQTVTDQGYHRVVDAISPEVKEEVARKAEAALTNTKWVPSNIQSQIAKVVLTSLDHESPRDSAKHATGVLEDEYGNVLGKIHIASNPAEQQPMRS
ncbi:hypothetical protein G7Y89_g8985 [Cudoniella acicularis]|uniref:Uncharacterized protein n=1 Tax=Cudoniella acicularis TaxID=354080 RepID=A0A8H4W2C4_9HELO|nr:hypothetical protein G7Y89_g8985 [Cudoniella acicularis]